MCLERDPIFYGAFRRGNMLSLADAKKLIARCKICEVVSTQSQSQKRAASASLPESTIKTRGSVTTEEKEREEKEREEKEREDEQRVREGRVREENAEGKKKKPT